MRVRRVRMLRARQNVVFNHVSMPQDILAARRLKRTKVR